MSKEFYEAKAKREENRRKQFLEIGNKFNNLFLQFIQFHDEGVSYGCSLLSTPSFAKVYELFLEKPHFFTFDQIWMKSGYHYNTVRKAIKRLEWFGVIVHEDNEPETWGLHLKNWADHR